ncbi:MAG: SH3 domain-containing protein [Pseudonocardia sp.]|nr:SH3 domain-containing protein [Pseudonocardia sp.]
MANRIKVPKLEASSFKGWMFVLLAGTLLAAIALFSGGGFSLTLGGATGVTGCTMKVLPQQLNVRSSPGTEFAPVETLTGGATVDAQRVVTNGFRQLTGTNRWALNESLAATPGSTC